MAPLQQLQDVLRNAPEDTPLQARVLIHWHTSGIAPQVEGPIETTLTVQKDRRGQPVGVNIDRPDVPEFDPRHDCVTGDFSGVQKAYLDSGELCFIEPIEINGVQINPIPAAEQGQGIRKQPRP